MRAQDADYAMKVMNMVKLFGMPGACVRARRRPPSIRLCVSPISRRPRRGPRRDGACGAVGVTKSAQDKKNTDVGANLFIGNLDPEVDERVMYDTFCAFGAIIAQPKVGQAVEEGGGARAAAAQRGVTARCACAADAGHGNGDVQGLRLRLVRRV